MIDLWRRLVSTSAEFVALGDFGFYEPERIKLYGPAYYRSNFHPGHLPQPVGGVLAQTKAVQYDLQMFMQGIAWAQYEASEREKTKT